MERNIPHIVLPHEWQEIAALEEVREAFGMTQEENMYWLQENSYAVRFNFSAGGPGYVGDLFYLVGDSLDEPMTIIRRDGKLAVN